MGDETTAHASGVTKLNSANLGILSHQGLVSVPPYNREITEDRNLIFHFGVGGFHRSHQAFYLNELLTRGENWGIVGVGIMPFDKPMIDALAPQNFLYTLMSRGSSGFGCSVVGSLLDFVYAPDDIQATLERMTSPQCKMISLTITEKGYCWDKDGDLDLEHPLIVRDLADVNKPASAMGYITAALKLRMERGVGPFTVLSCDNIPDNGHKTQALILTLAKHYDPALAKWIEDNVPFPMTMVDRITPGTTDHDRQLLAEQYCIEDAWPVVAEDYMQWVIEDKFVNGCRPNWEAAGAMLVDNVHAYEMMKVRVLNGGHSAISCVAYLLGHRDVHESLTDARVLHFLRAYFQEVVNTVPPVPGVDLDQYQNRLIQRFSNVHIRDKLQRLAEDGSMKLYNTMRGPLIDLLEKSQSIDMIALSIAGYTRYLMGSDEQGNAISIKDPMAAQLFPEVYQMYCNGRSSSNFIDMVFGSEFTENSKDLVAAVDRWVAILKSEGISSALSLLIPEHVSATSAYEAMKLRLLNGGYCALAFVAFLLGHREMDSAMADTRVAQFLRSYFAEVVTTVKGLGEGVEDYMLSLLARFSSQYVREELVTLAANGSFKLFNTMRGAVLDLLEARESIDVVALALAAYSRYLLGTDERGAPITVKDPLTPTLYPLAWQMYTCNASARKLVEAVLGYEVAEKNEFVASVDHWASIIKDKGVSDALLKVSDLWKGSEFGDELSEIGEVHTGPLKLNRHVLDALGYEGLVSVPTYNREITPDKKLIYHFGVGGFHRSHQAFYLHELLMQGVGSDWGIVGMGIMPFDKKMADVLKEQDYLYTLVSRGASGFGCSILGSIMGFVFAPDNVPGALENLADPQCKIVSLTITEKGYCFDPDGNLDFSHPLIVRDLADVSKPGSALGYIIAALKIRRERGIPPFTLLSCDNIPENGEVTERLVLDLANKIDPELAGWIKDNVPFPSTMVDRITPVTTDQDKKQLTEQYGFEDEWPVVAEDFYQWVIEDRFIDNCRPPWEKAGALVVAHDQVRASETMKIRLLNGGHSALSYLSYLLGHRVVDKAMADPRVSNFLRAYFAEVAATVPEVPGVDLEQYQFSLITRFSNVHICDQVQRLAMDGSMKLLNTMSGPIKERLDMGKPVDMLAMAVAGYSRYMMGIDEQGGPIVTQDPQGAAVHSVVWKLYCANNTSKHFVEKIFGSELSDREEFVSAVDRCVQLIKSQDVATAMATIYKSFEEHECVIAEEPPALSCMGSVPSMSSLAAFAVAGGALAE